MRILLSQKEVHEIVAEHVRTNLDLEKPFQVKEFVGNLEVSEQAYFEIIVKEGTKNAEVPFGYLAR